MSNLSAGELKLELNMSKSSISESTAMKVIIKVYLVYVNLPFSVHKC
jgi:DNA-binding transcriptional regulator GbsR (MarR family)